jgi:excisionase family DNA binding protein
MMHLNRLLTRRQIVELNDLTHEEESAVFSLLRPLLGMGEAAKFLESQADRGIEVMRSRPPEPPEVSSFAMEDDIVVSLNLPTDHLVRIADGIDRLVDALTPKVTPEVEPTVRMLTAEEASNRMRLSPQTVMKWCRQGKLGTKCGRTWLIDPKEVDRYHRGILMTKGRKVAP